MPGAGGMVVRMLECDKPIIARVNGHAVGLGATVALLCDIIIAVDHAKIGDPHVNAGLVAGERGAPALATPPRSCRVEENLCHAAPMTPRGAGSSRVLDHRC